MNTSKCFAYLLIFLFINLNCSKDRDETTPETVDKYQIRLILQDNLIFVNYPIELLRRSDCKKFADVTTDEEGIFELTDFTPEDIIAVADPLGEPTWSLIPASSFRENVISEVRFADTRVFDTFGLRPEFEIDEPDSDSLLLEFDLIIPDYPIEKASVEIFSAEYQFRRTVNPSKEGRVSLNLPIIPGRSHNLDIAFRDNFSNILWSTNSRIVVTKAYDANLRSEVTTCKDILLQWDQYQGDDFIEYQITYKSQYQIGDVTCDNLNGLFFTADQFTTSTIISDYAYERPLCFSIVAQTTEGNTKSTDHTAQPPVTELIESNGILRTDFLEDGTPIVLHENLIDLSPTICKKDLATGSLDCFSNRGNGQIIKTQVVDDVYRVFEIKDNSNLVLYDENWKVTSSLALPSDQQDFIFASKNYLVNTYFDNQFGVRIFDIEDNSFGKGIELANRYELKNLVAVPTSSQFGLLVYDNNLSQDILQIYTVEGIDKITLEQSFPLTGNEEPSYDFFNFSRGGHILFSEFGAFLDLTSEDGIVNNRLGTGYVTNRSWINEQYILFLDNDRGMMVLYDYKNQSVESETSMCSGQILGLTDSNEVLISKDFLGNLAIELVSL